jgi:predicted DNA-binding transcriptional regulator AlpA
MLHFRDEARKASQQCNNHREDEMGRLLTVGETADILGVTPTTVYRAIAAGEIAWVDIAIASGARRPRPRIRITSAAIEEFLARRTSPAAA